MPGQSIPGAIAGAFRSDRPDIRYTTVDPNRQRRLDSIWSEYDTSADPTKNADYLAAYAAGTPQARKIAGSNIDWLNEYVASSSDPTNYYTSILGANKAALGDFLINPALNRLTKQRKEAQARGGYGGMGAGTYDSLLESRILQQLASEAVPNLLGYTTQAYGTAGNIAQNNFLNRLGIIGSGEQFRQLDIPALRYLEPTRLARSDVRANLANLAGIATQEDLNRAYYRQPGLAERIGRGFNEVQSGIYNEASDVLDLYSRAYGSGMLGGMGVTGGGPPGSSGAGQWGSAGGGAKTFGGGGARPAYSTPSYGSSPYGTGLDWRYRMYESPPPWAGQ